MPESQLAANRSETPPLAGKVCPSSPILEVAAPAFSKVRPDIVSVQPPPVSPLQSAPPSAACPSASARSLSPIPKRTWRGLLPARAPSAKRQRTAALQDPSRIDSRYESPTGFGVRQSSAAFPATRCIGLSLRIFSLCFGAFLLELLWS